MFNQLAKQRTGERTKFRNKKKSKLRNIKIPLFKGGAGQKEKGKEKKRNPKKRWKL